MDNLLDWVVADQSARERLDPYQKCLVLFLSLRMVLLQCLKAADVFQWMVDQMLTAFAFRPDIVFCFHHVAIASPSLY